MRIGTTIGDTAERIPLVDTAVRRVRTLCRSLRGRWRGSNGGVRRETYAAWIRLHDTLSAGEAESLRAAGRAFALQPTISVIMPVFNTEPAILDQAIRSVREQLYERWELCIVDDVSTRSALRAVLESHAAADPRIKVRYHTSRGNISASSNTALEMATGEFVALVDHDDVLPPHALHWVVEAINRHPDAALLYSDEDKLDVRGRRRDPYFKGDFNHELLLTQNMVSHLGVYRRDLVLELGGFRSEFDGSQDHDLALRVAAAVPRGRIVHIPRILYHWRAIAGSAASSLHAKPDSSDAGRRAVADHLRRLGQTAAVEAAPEAPWYQRIRHPLPAELPLVSIVICTRDHGRLVRAAVDSITRRSTYGNYEILIVDNGSRDPRTLDCLAELARRPRITVVHDDSPFNYSRLNNAGVALTRGEVVCLLNDDVEVIAPDWLEELVSQAIRPDVGAVAGHAHPRLPHGHRGYFCRSVLQQEVSAVTGACLAVRRTVYDEVGGLDELLPVAFNDIDFCLKLRRAGYRNIWTPYAELLHHESATRGPDTDPERAPRFDRDTRFMRARWGDALSFDPYYNRNLSSKGDYSLDVPSRAPAGDRVARRAG